MPLRPATDADIDGMHRVRMAVQENRLSSPGLIGPADYLREIAVTGRGWVVEHDGDIVGFSVGRRTDGNIWALFVDPAHEGRGHGSLLHDAMVQWLWAQGLQRLWLTTETGSRAERFYRRRGWRACGGGTLADLRFELERPAAD